MLNTKFKFTTFFLSVTFFLLCITSVSAYEIVELDVFDENRFELGPTMYQVVAKRGDTITKQLQLTNRSGREQKYNILVRDFIGSENPLQFTTILEETQSEYGASKWFDTEIETMFLDHGDRLLFDVEIKIPEYADAGEHYAVVIAEPDEYGEFENGGAIVTTRSRVGTLFLIDVEGQRIKSAELSNFFSDSSFYEKTPVNLSVDVENTGNVHVSPKGSITITNIFGKQIEELEVNEFLVLRDSVRRRTIAWNKGFALGKYSAELKLDLGLGSVNQGGVVEFWIIPWKLLIIIFTITVVIFLLLRFILSKVKIEVKLQ